jgi:hypothetical protein
MAAGAFFRDGSYRPVPLIPCDDKTNQGEDCQDSATLNAAAGVLSSSTLAVSQKSVDTRSLTLILRAPRFSHSPDLGTAKTTANQKSEAFRRD